MHKITAIAALVLCLTLGAVAGAYAQATPAAPTTTPSAQPTPAATATPTAALAPTATVTATGALTITATLLPTATPTPAISPTPTRPATPVSKTLQAAASERVELTLYNQYLAMVREYRTLTLAAGENAVRYGGIPAQIVPASLRVLSLSNPAGTLLLEQTYEYDTPSSDRLLTRYVNQEITLTTRDGAAFTGTLLAAGGDVMLATTRGIVIVKADQVQQYELPLLPEGPVTQPSLLWRLQADKAGENRLLVTYLTGGMSWSTDYAAVLSADETTLALDSWVTLNNQSGASYLNAKLKLVAGTLNRAASAYGPYYADSKAGAQVTQSALLDYHAYDVQRPVTLLDQQSKQIAFLTAPEVSARKVYVYDASPAYTLSAGQANTDPAFGVQAGTAVQVRVEFSNTVASGLGMPLPAGVVRVYAEDAAGAAEWVGEDSIGHTPVGVALSLTLGQAFDVLAERAQTSFRQLSERSIEETTEIVLRNQKEEDVTVRVIEHLFRAEDAEVLSSTQNYTQIDAHTIQFDVKVLAGGKVTLEYSTRYRW
jgi:hypothetical protein